MRLKLSIAIKRLLFISYEFSLLKKRFTYPERFTRGLSKKLSDIGSYIKVMMATGNTFTNDDKLLDNQDMSFLLKVSYQTLKRYRNSGKLRYFLVRHKTFYRKD